MPVLTAQHMQVVRETAIWKPHDKISLYIFDSSQFRLLVVDEDSVSAPRYGSIDKAMTETGCTAGINGSFFSANSIGSPLGLSISSGKRISPFASASFAVSGVLYDDGKKIALVRSKNFKQGELTNLRQAIQGGPFLIENGRPVTGLHDTKIAMRTFVATDGKGKWCIGNSSSLSLKALAEWLSTPDLFGDFKIKTALNLDGGSSSAYWVRKPHLNYPSIKQVRNYVGIIPRHQRGNIPSKRKH